MLGGARKGAGRKLNPFKKKMVSIRLDPIVIERLKTIPKYGPYIQRLICKDQGIDLGE